MNNENEKIGRELAEVAGLKVLYQNSIPGYGYVSKVHNDMLLTAALCGSLDAVSEVEKIVIERVGYEKYGEHLHKILFSDVPRTEKLYYSHVAAMTARQKALACLAALREGEKE